MAIKKWILKTVQKLGYIVFQKKDFAQKVKQTHTPELKQAWLDGVKLISDRQSVLSQLPKAERVAEMGVGYGDFSVEIIKALKPLEFVAIDVFDGNENDKWGAPLNEHKMTHSEYFLYKLGDCIKNCSVNLRKGMSWDEIAKFQDSYFDYIYIDADHKYASVKKDITASATKIKVGGYMQCNDFSHFDTDNYVHYGVPRAVVELLETGTYKMCYFCFATDGFYDVVLQRIS